MAKIHPSPDVLYDQIQAAIQRLRSLSQKNVQASWHLCMEDVEVAQALNPDTWRDWPIASCNRHYHISWPKGRQVLWLGQRFQMPTALIFEGQNGYPLSDLLVRLSLIWWAEDSQIFVNGERVQCGDLYDCSARILLQSSVLPGDEIAVAIRLISPGHDDGALVKSVMIYENPNNDVGEDNQYVPEPGFVADELAVLAHYLRTFQPQQLATIATTINQLPWNHVRDRRTFDDAIALLRQQLLPFSNWIKQRSIKLLGHAHLDLAWLWPISETWDVAQRTFESALTLQADYPDLIFGHSSPMLYEWIERHRPDLFDKIQDQIATGQWEAIAGLWVEPELNVVGGESIVRHVLYGQRYCQQKFGRISRLAWLPDTFGFCWQLPQILRQGGIDYFITQKLRWNDTTAFPHEWFEWQAPDGTTIPSLMSAPIGTTIDPVQMVEYACAWETATGQRTCLWLPGVGDHGGGPTRDMIELVHRWQRSPFFPALEFSTAIDFLDDLLKAEIKAEGEVKAEGRRQKAEGRRQKAEGRRQRSGEAEERRGRGAEGQRSGGAEERRGRGEGETGSPIQHPTSNIQHLKSKIPRWSDELYLELHRGCYTAHADQKYWNRRCEALLYEAELWSTIATLLTGAIYPKQTIEQTWKIVLFNQFHDILPGSSIPDVYEEVNPQWERAIATSESMIEAALQTLSQTLYATKATKATKTTHAINAPRRPQPLNKDSIPLLIFNPLNWDRTDIVTVSLPPQLATIHHWVAQTPDGTVLPCQYVSSPIPHSPTFSTIQNQPTPSPSQEGDRSIQFSQLSNSPTLQLSDQNPKSKIQNPKSPPSLHPKAVTAQLLIVPPSVPAIGYCLCWLTPSPSAKMEATNATKSPDYRLENTTLCITIDPTTGNLQSITDKLHNRSILSEPGNQLLAFNDDGEYWDAWNIAPNYRERPLPGPTLQSIEWIENGPVEQRLRVIRILGTSTFIQDYVLHINSGIVRIESEVDWRDRHTLVKAAFPFSIKATYATYDMSFGAIQRSTHPGTPAEKAKWEVSGLGWADLTEKTDTSTHQPESHSENYGVSILSDYKHGYSATPSELQLTLLRGSTWPDPKADQGHHSFVYAIYPHAGTWQAAHTAHCSYELRHPLQARLLVDKEMAQTADPFPSLEFRNRSEKNAFRGSFMTIPGDHFIVSAVKQSEDCEHTWIVRGYECHGESGPLCLGNNLVFQTPSIQNASQLSSQLSSQQPATHNLLNFSEVKENVSLLEQYLLSPEASSKQVTDNIRPWGIYTWAVQNVQGSAEVSGQ